MAKRWRARAWTHGSFASSWPAASHCGQRTGRPSAKARSRVGRPVGCSCGWRRSTRRCHTSSWPTTSGVRRGRRPGMSPCARWSASCGRCSPGSARRGRCRAETAPMRSASLPTPGWISMRPLRPSTFRRRRWPTATCPAPAAGPWRPGPSPRDRSCRANRANGSRHLRRRMTDVRLRALETLAEIWIEQGDAALAARDAAEAIEIDPYRESAHRLLIRAYLAAGDRGAAARALEACRRVLEEELGVTPSPATLALIALSGAAASGRAEPRPFHAQMARTKNATSGCRRTRPTTLTPAGSQVVVTRVLSLPPRGARTRARR